MWGGEVAVITGGVWGAHGPHRGSVRWRKDGLPGLKEEERLQHGQGSIRTPWTIQKFLLILTVLGEEDMFTVPSHNMAQKRLRNIWCVRRNLYVSGMRLFCH